MTSDIISEMCELVRGRRKSDPYAFEKLRYESFDTDIVIEVNSDFNVLAMNDLAFVQAYEVCLQANEVCLQPNDVL